MPLLTRTEGMRGCGHSARDFLRSREITCVAARRRAVAGSGRGGRPQTAQTCAGDAGASSIRTRCNCAK